MRESEVFGSVLDEGLANGAAVRFRAEGLSMYPTIRDGEMVTVVPIVPADVICGDILLCRHGARLLAHRVVAIASSAGTRTFSLRGDAKSACDAPVDGRALVGKVIDVQRHSRRIGLSGPAARARRAARSAASRSKRLLVATSGRMRDLVRRAVAPHTVAPRR
jgi:hypothetical protein